MLTVNILCRNTFFKASNFQVEIQLQKMYVIGYILRYILSIYCYDSLLKRFKSSLYS
jgi:hypothetical protein